MTQTDQSQSIYFSLGFAVSVNNAAVVQMLDAHITNHKQEHRSHLLSPRYGESAALAGVRMTVRLTKEAWAASLLALNSRNYSLPQGV